MAPGLQAEPSGTCASRSCTARKVLQTMESEDLALEKDRLEVETMRLKTEKLRAKLNETQNSKNSDN